MRKLYLFTAAFPYSSTETFLETEIIYLAKRFERIIIIPLSGKKNMMREVPHNCIVFNPIINNKFQQYFFGVFGWKAMPLFFKDFFKEKVYNDKRKLKTWFIAYVIANSYLHNFKFSNLVESISVSDLIYFYWGKGGNIIAPILDKRTKIICRFHGEWDLWEESSGNYSPLRSVISKSIDLAVFISKKGEDYFKKRYEISRTLVSKLGTMENGISIKSKDNVIRILSCSSVIPLKRVPLIFNALQLIENVNIVWTHIGSGKDFELLKKIVKTTKTNVNVNLTGAMDNKSVLNYYKENKIDIFINMSENEGIPVSIMEAISCDIPIIATNVGGTSEIVTDKTGILLSSNPSGQDIVNAIFKLQNLKLKPRELWEKEYNADINYKKFTEIIFNV